MLITALAILTRQFDYHSFVNSFKGISWVYVAVLVLLQLITQLLLNYQWCRIGRVLGCPLDFVGMLYVNAQGTLMESVTPGVKVGGEVTRGYLLKKELGCSIDQAVAVVALQKLFSLSAFFGLNLLALFHLSNRLALPADWQKLIYLLLFSLTCLMLTFLFFPEKIAGRLERCSPGPKWLQSGKGLLLELLTHTTRLKGYRREWWKQFVLAVMIWLLFPVKLLLLVRVFSGNGDFLFVSAVAFISYLMGMMPLTPGGLGSFEATMTGLLVLMDLNVYDAAVITVVFRFITFWFVVLLSIGFVACWQIFRMRGTKDETAKTTAQSAYADQHDPGTCGHFSG